jgi:hypothetical protein
MERRFAIAFAIAGLVVGVLGWASSAETAGPAKAQAGGSTAARNGQGSVRPSSRRRALRFAVGRAAREGPAAGADRPDLRDRPGQQARRARRDRPGRRT